MINICSTMLKSDLMTSHDINYHITCLSWLVESNKCCWTLSNAWLCGLGYWWPESQVKLNTALSVSIKKELQKYEVCLNCHQLLSFAMLICCELFNYSWFKWEAFCAACGAGWNQISRHSSTPQPVWLLHHEAIVKICENQIHLPRRCWTSKI